MARRRQHHGPHGGGQEAGFLGNADAQHGHQHDAQRRKTGKVGDQAGPDAADAVAIEQADRADHAVLGDPAGTGRTRILDGQAHPAEQAGEQHDPEGQDGEQRDRMRQKITQPFNAIQEAREGAAPRFGATGSGL